MVPISDQTLFNYFGGGTTTFSNPTLIGGYDFGIPLITGNLNVVCSGGVTGFINTIFTGSGYYSGILSFQIRGTGVVLNYSKSFTGCWDLLTGIPFRQVDYLARGFYNPGATKTGYLNNYPTYYNYGTETIKVTYNNPYDSFNDIALLTITGSGFPTGLNMIISGNRLI